MTIDDLVATLSHNDPRPAGLAPTIAVSLAVILALVVVLTISTAWFVLRPDLTAGLVIHNNIFLFKLIFTSGIVASALPIVRNLSIPGRRTRWSTVLAAAPFGLVAALALRELSRLPSNEWLRHVDHGSWVECLWQIPALAIPAFVILVLAVRQLAPTYLSRTGACIGLLAGGIGAVGYTLHCHDNAIALVAASYSAAIFEMALLGALLGPRLLRWG